MTLSIYRINFKLVLPAFLACLLAGCGSLDFLFGDSGYFRNRSKDYQKSTEAARIEVPEGLDSSAFEDIYVIPPVTNAGGLDKDFDVPRPLPLVASELEQAVKIQKLGNERWMLAALAPGELWPQLRAYLSAKGIAVSRVDARRGLIETAWFDSKDGGLKQRYRFSIDEGVQRNTSELHILHMLQTPEGDLSWPEVSADTELESEMMTDVANYIANRTDMASVSMVAQQAISATGKVSLGEDGSGRPYVHLRLPYYRAWASLGKALQKSGFEVKDLDRSAGKYYVSFVEPVREQDEEDSGWFSWMFNEEQQRQLAEDYLITVKVVDEGNVSINIDSQSESSEPLGKAEAEKLLAVVKGNLS